MVERKITKDEQDFIVTFTGTQDYSITPLVGDGSQRKLYSITYRKTTAVLVLFDNIEENEAFFLLTNALQAIQVAVPSIYAIAPNRKAYILEYLGDLRLDEKLASLAKQKDQKAVVSLYENVIQTLIHIQKKLIHVVPLTVYKREMDNSILQSYVQLFFDEFISYYKLEKDCPPSLQTSIKNDLVKELGSLERNVISLRDFQARNVMLQGSKLVYLDYQDAYRGTVYYDLASLLYASSSFLNEESISYLIHTFYSLSSLEQTSFNLFNERLYKFVLLRRLHSLGIYAYLGNKQGKKHFLPKIKPALANLNNLLAKQKVFASYTELSIALQKIEQKWN